MNRDWSKSLVTHVLKLDLFDLLVLIYIVVFVRQYFWFIPNNRTAWFLTSTVSLGFGAAYLALSEPRVEKRPLGFWVIVGLPLLFIYLLRVGYPDFSYDVLTYHIFHAERALRGLIYIPGDFAPASFPYFNNPAPDMITGLFRHLFGFRLGTISNYLALLWTGSIVFKFFRHDIKNSTARSFAVLLVLFSEQLFWQINNYMVDLLALPALMEATYLTLRQENAQSIPRKQYILISALLGTSVALKLTNLVFAVPIGLVAMRKLVTQRPLSQLWGTTGAMALGFMLPLLPHAIYLYWTTNNPVFPLYNKLFQSPYWPNDNVFDGRWGPQGVWQTIFWPFISLFRKDRLTELHLYSGKLSLGLCALLLLFLFVRQRRVREFGFVMMVSAFLWSLGTGYIRYGLYLEVLGGISLVLLAAYFWQSSWKSRVLAAAVCMVLLLQSILAFVYSWEREWGGRPVGLLQPREYGKELRESFSDRYLPNYLNAQQRDVFAGVEGWVETGYKTSAVTALLRPDLPYLNVFSEAFFATPAAMRKLRAAKNLLAGRRLLSIVFEENLQTALEKLHTQRFSAVKTTLIELPYYSTQSRMRLAVIEVAPDPTGGSGNSLFNAQIAVINGLPSTMKTGEQASVQVRVKNLSRVSWPSKKNGQNAVTFGNKWLDESGRIVINDDGRAPLTDDLAPGAELELELLIRAPVEPGTYTLMLDLVQEQVSWFYERGSTPLEQQVTVDR